MYIMLSKPDLDMAGVELVEHYCRLGFKDRLYRFFKRMDSHSIQGWLEMIQQGNFDQEFVLMTDTNDHHKIVGVGQVSFQGTDLADLSVSVDPEFRNIGVASIITRKMIMKAREKGINTVMMVCRGDNSPMISIMQKMGFELSYMIHTGEVYGFLKV